MGIAGLLLGLKHCAVDGNVRDFANQAVAVDTSSWLHKSVYSIADHYVEAVEQNQTPDARSIRASTSYVQKRCQELLSYANIRKVYLVMDGRRCPLKAGTNQERDSRRQDNLREARKHRQAGDRDRMYEKYKACIKVHADLARIVAQDVERHFAARNNNQRTQVEVVWSPYEADAQLVQLCLDGRAQAIITEDSDVLVYTAACQIAVPILFKLDRNSGSCTVLTVDWLLNPSNNNNNNNDPRDAATAMENDNQTNNNNNAGNNKKKSGKSTKKKPAAGLEPTLQSFALRQGRSPGLGARLFVQSCVLTGCDYSPNLLAGVGLISAFRQVQASMHRSSEDRFRNALNLLPSKATATIANGNSSNNNSGSGSGSNDKIEYEELLAKSEAVFYFHPVRLADGQITYLSDPHRTDLEDRHIPSLVRFGGDWTFLGDLSAPELVVDNNNNNNNSSNNNNHGHRHHHSKRKGGVPPPPPKEQHTVAGMFRSHNNKVPAVVAVSNPYAPQQKKRKRSEQQKQQPLASKSDREEGKKKNPFASFAAAALPSKSKPKKSGPLDKFMAREDVRFVKRDFSKQQSGATLSKAEAKAAAGSARSSSHTGIRPGSSSRNRPKKTGPMDRLLRRANAKQQQQQQQQREEIIVLDDDDEEDEDDERRPQKRPFQPSRGTLMERIRAPVVRDTETARSEPPPEPPFHAAGSFDRSRADGPQSQEDSLDERADSGRRRNNHHSSFDYGLRESSNSVDDTSYDRSENATRAGNNRAPFEGVDGLVRRENASPDRKLPAGATKGKRGLPYLHERSSLEDEDDDDDSVVILEGQDQTNYQSDSVFDQLISNPGFHSSEPEDVTVSRYFGRGGGKREVTRRVTLESPETKPAYDSFDASAASMPQNEQFSFSDPVAGTFQQQQQQQGPSSFSVYDDFLESPKASSPARAGAELPDDEILDDSPESSAAKRGGLSVFQPNFNPLARRFAPPKPHSNIGPSKTMRFRFGPLA